MRPYADAGIKETVSMLDVIGLSPSEAVKRLNECGLIVETDGEGDTVVSSTPIPQTVVEKGDVVLVRT